MRPVPEYDHVDPDRFEQEIMAAGRPAVLRGLCAQWPAALAAARGDEGLAAYLRGCANDAPFEAWFGPPDIEGRFGYGEDLEGFNHDRRLATVGQLLDLLLRQRGHARPFSMYAGAIPVPRHLPGLAAETATLEPGDALYHALMTMAALPPNELAAWRTLFDHYVFRDHGDPAAHLPEDARGILGRRTPELVARLKAMLARALGR